MTRALRLLIVVAIFTLPEMATGGTPQGDDVMFEAPPVALQASGTPPNAERGNVYFGGSVEVMYWGGVVVISGCPHGACPFLVDDAVRLTVHRPDLTISSREITSFSDPHPATDVTDLFAAGVNLVFVDLVDLVGDQFGAPGGLYLLSGIHNLRTGFEPDDPVVPSSAEGFAIEEGIGLDGGYGGLLATDGVQPSFVSFNVEVTHRYTFVRLHLFLRELDAAGFDVLTLSEDEGRFLVDLDVRLGGRLYLTFGDGGYTVSSEPLPVGRWFALQVNVHHLVESEQLGISILIDGLPADGVEPVMFPGTSSYGVVDIGQRHTSGHPFAVVIDDLDIAARCADSYAGDDQETQGQETPGVVPEETLAPTVPSTPTPAATPSPTPAPTATPTPLPSPTATPAEPVSDRVPAPAGLVAEARNTVVQLTWEPVEGATGYLVFRDGADRPLNATPVQTTTYEDIGLTNGREYSYEVAAIDEAGEPGERSGRVSATPSKGG